MRIDQLDQQTLNYDSASSFTKLEGFRSSFEESLGEIGDYFGGLDPEAIQSVSTWLNIENMQFNPNMMNELTGITVNLLDGGVDLNGNPTLGLKKIYSFNRHEDYYDINTKQQAGFCAEVISTAKENLKAKMEGSDHVTYRADDRPDLFPKNDQYVDKIRVDGNDNIIERIQTKFVGHDGQSCWNKLKSQKFEKYLDDAKVDKIEIPREYYDEIMEKNIIGNEISELEKQIESLKSQGKTDLVEKKVQKLEKIKKLESKLERSNTTMEEALEARKNPDGYARKIFSSETLYESHKAGLDNAAVAVSITLAVSTVDNLQKYMNGEVTAKEAFVDVALDAGKAGAMGYGAAFVSTSVTAVMSQSSHELVQSLAGAGVPGATVAFGIEVYDSVIDYAQGNIDGNQLVYDLGEGGAHVVGGILGSAAAGAVLGSVVPGAGTVAGFGAGLVGGMVGVAVASEAYTTAVEYGTEGAKVLKEKVVNLAHDTYERAKEEIPTGAEDVRNALNDFSDKYNLPFHI